MQKLPVPNVTLNPQDQGSVFQAKMNTLADACRTAVQTFNNSVDAAATAQQYSNMISQALVPAVVDGYRRTVETASGGKNTVIYDAQGNPNIMVVVPRFNYEDLNLPALELGTGTPTAFQTNGVPRGEILIAKYLASTPSGTTGCSVIGGVQPRVSVTFDAAKNLCEIGRAHV